MSELAKVETRRYARHPVFLLGLVLGIVSLYAALNHVTDDYYGPPVIPAFFLGVFGMVVAFRLTRTMERSAEAVESSPTPVHQRVGALLLACLLPAALGLLAGLAILGLGEVKADWAYGTWSTDERVAIILGQSLVAGLGGPLLGVAAARWLRFPGAVVVPVIAVSTWVIMVNGWSATNQDSTGWLVARLFSPLAFFTTLDTDGGTHRVESWRGDPWFYLLWLVLLCALAAIVALLKGAEGETRARLRSSLVVAVVLALAALTLAVTSGPDHTTVRSPAGVTGI
ncbi:MAG TPA: hypothetical protein VM097_12145 [Mycobacteriales bacterium]|nr:hypothetical protein [Mycobacteriales bacterium]